MESDNLAVVYPVAGLSSRFGGGMKWLVKVGPNGESLVEYSMNQALKVGFNKIIFVVGSQTEKVFKKLFGDSYKGISICYAFQEFDKESRDKPWGTTDALFAAKDLIDCPVVYCNADDLYGEKSFEILAEHLKNNTEENATLGYRLEDVVPEEGSVNRAIFNVDEDNYLTDLKEVLNIEKDKLEEKGLTLDNLVSMNIFAFFPETIDKLGEELARFKEENKGNRTAECLLPESVSNLIKQGEIKMKLYPTPEKWYGITNPEDEEIVRRALSEDGKD